MSAKPMSALVANEVGIRRAGSPATTNSVAKETEMVRATDDEERATRIAMMQALTVMANKETPRQGVRTEIVGIFALLIGMMIQTGAGFYWAGQQSQKYESLQSAVADIKAVQTYQGAQLQVIDGNQKKQEGREAAMKGK